PKLEMNLFVNELYSTFNKLFNEGRSVRDIIINFISKHSKNQKEVFNWLVEHKGDSKNACMLGLFYSWDIGIEKSNAEAFDLFFAATNNGDVIAQYFLGRCYEIGWNTKKNMKKAIEQYYEAAKKGCAAAEYKLGDYFYKINKYTQAYPLLKSAADKRNAMALNTLGLCYQKGRGTNANKAEGFKIFEQAAKMGLPASQYELGNCYEYGEGVEKNWNKALYWYQKAVEKDVNYRNHLKRVESKIKFD
ncbi:3043_t:CDS:1, partial [Scutellospora calospora]